ncbi:hypothetical protein [Coprococcus comes]|uniref:Uncharacterized protein n=1 Tax=Coprococcus comes TaxID=410072 RepID=A0A849XTJ5_9FIRM|nr:hypothetical protein [Coprococcus comes]NUN85070.1 hypothetical protein [Coprococcus comes]
MWKTWIPRRYWEISIRRQEELERRVKRLELILLKEAENKLASLSDKEAGKKYKDGYLSIEDIIDRRTKVERKYVDQVMYM